MESYMIGYHHEVRPKGTLCSCGHDKDNHSSSVSGDTICYGSPNGDCKCGCSYPSRVRMPRIGSVQEVNVNLSKPQFRPHMKTGKILKIIKAERVYHRYHGEDVYVLCEVEIKINETKNYTKLAYVQWADEEE